MIFYDYGKQRIVHRSNDRIISIKPIYLEYQNKYNTFFKLWESLLKMSKEFPQEKIVAEMQNVCEVDYDMIKDEIGIGDNFTDHVSRFYLNVSLNATIIVHKIY